MQRLRDFIQGRWPKAQVVIYGSHVTGLSLFTSDIDTVVLGLGVEKPIYALGDALHQKDFVLDLQVFHPLKCMSTMIL